MITGSHNPRITTVSNWFWRTVRSGRIKFSSSESAARRATGSRARRKTGTERPRILCLASLPGLSLGARVKVVWDVGNASVGPAVVELARRLPGHHVVLNETVDGMFPAHHPDPTMPENLTDLINSVIDMRYDLGIAFDGDGDRIGAVDGEGRIVWGDQLLVIYAKELLGRRPGVEVIADVKASQMLFNEIEKLGGKPVMCAPGHSVIKSLMVESGAPLAGEMSWHVFFADGNYGYDDALYAANRLWISSPPRTAVSRRCCPNCRRW